MTDIQEIVREAEAAIQLLETKVFEPEPKDYEIKDYEISDSPAAFWLNPLSPVDTKDLIQRLLDVVKEREWKSIDSAPKDGTLILLKGNGWIMQGLWQNGNWGEDWYFTKETTVSLAVPKYWQPIPPKPEAGGE